jgi:hypothetical protein
MPLVGFKKNSHSPCPTLWACHRPSQAPAARPASARNVPAHPPCPNGPHPDALRSLGRSTRFAQARYAAALPRKNESKTGTAGPPPQPWNTAPKAVSPSFLRLRLCAGRVIPLPFGFDFSIAAVPPLPSPGGKVSPMRVSDTATHLSDIQALWRNSFLRNVARQTV